MNNQQAAQLASGDQPTVVNKSGIVMDNLIQEWNQAKSYVDQYTRDFPQLANLVDGVPLSPDPDSPYVGDTTLAGLVREMPRESLQQLPVFSMTVNGSKNNRTALICTYLLKKNVFNEDTFGKGLLSTLQLGAEQALTNGFCAFLPTIGQGWNDNGTTLKLLHYSDVALEPGVTDANEAGYHYVKANVTPTRARQVLAAAKRSKNSTWNPDIIQRVLDGAPRSDNYTQYESDPKKNAAGEAMGPTYNWVTRYPTGTLEPIITFDTDEREAPLRTMESNSKFGYPRVLYLVIDPAALTPFGTSRVRLASPNQNLMNIYYGQVAAMLLLNTKPPILKRGRFSTPVELVQGVTWETDNPQANATLVNLDNGSLQFFPIMAQQFAGQIQNIMGGKSQQIGGGGKSEFGKTGPGQKRAQASEDIKSNQITKILENFLRQYALVALDLVLSEQIGEDDLIVDDDTKQALNAIEPGFVGDDNVVKMEWETFYAAIKEWQVEISVSVSKDEMDEKKRADLQDMLVVIGQNVEKLGPDAQQQFTNITNMLLEDKAPLVKTLSPALPSNQPTPQQMLPAQATPPTPVA